jgi:hypothetical protein
MTLAPDPLAKSKGGTQRGGWIETEIIACDRAAVVVDHDRQPRPQRGAVLLEQQDVELRMINLPNGVRFRSFAPMHHVKVLAVGSCPLMRQDHQAIRKRTHKSVDRPVARHWLAGCFRKLPDLTVDGCDWNRGSFECQALNRGLDPR